ncbi:ABC transporter substrate-binding protein [Halopiger djelfimassiliensis]|uniref:ABC transporter substrate-binding protein n=1 Tax=Halopiger djelfimassiliensis TaxID=1293047 RepID=UPI00067829D6|nr:ABC transporter substrate-binding protein [Halopiger djelfimassiliensis]
MASNAVHQAVPTRRDYLKGGGTVVGGGLLAGCIAEPNGSADDGATTGTGGSYTVSMAPMGEVEFDSVPESVFTRLTHHAGMAFALGRGEQVNAMHAPGYYDALWNQFTPRLDGVTLDWSDCEPSWEVSKEQLYELDSDVHLADPASVAALDGWSESDLEEVGQYLGPWFGNKFSDRHETPPSGWADDYRYYSLWELFERVARVFREQDRYRTLAAIRERLLEWFDAELPAVEARPTAVMLGLSDLDTIYAYTLSNPGFLTAHTRPLGPVGALGDDVKSGAVIDFERLLDADPDVIFVLGGLHPETDMVDIRTRLEDHAVARELSAVQNGRVYPQGARYQGPILNLFQLEMTAKQLYPDRFGEWPTYTTGPYPEIPGDEQLFDRQRVADCITGND